MPTPLIFPEHYKNLFSLMNHYFWAFMIAIALPCSAWATQPDAVEDLKSVTGVILLNESKSPDWTKLIAALKTDARIKVDSVIVKDGTVSFSSNGAEVLLAYLNTPGNKEEMNAAAGISWLWKNAAESVAQHKSRLVVTILGPKEKTLDLYRLFTKTAGGLLAYRADATGVYMNNQFLLLQRGYYIEAAKNMAPDGIPIYCWVYFGILQNENLSSAYTFGMHEFGYQEMELVNSKRPLQEAHALIFDAAQAALLSPKPWSDGQVVDLGGNLKIKTTLSPPTLIGGVPTTIKIEEVLK